MNEHRHSANTGRSLPSRARLSINHCNLPAAILGSLTFQRHPVPLQLDGIAALHAALFDSLDTRSDAGERAVYFKAYMRSCFLLDHPDEAGFDPTSQSAPRYKSDYLRLLRGWLFDPDGQEAAVMKSWVESRFGLLPRNHHGPLGDFSQQNYQVYLADRSAGLYNSNALESQLDLLYSYCQYELRRQFPAEPHIRLYRGINAIDDHEILAQPDRHHYVLVLNNLNSFTGNRERADEFGDYILEARVPRVKLLFMPALLPDIMDGEDEYLVIGGVYEVCLSTL